MADLQPETNKKPRTPAQIEASRRNGAKSRGPKTAEGRRRSSRNSRKHGLRAETDLVLDYEDPEAFSALLDGYTRTYQPANFAEAQLVQELARCAWRLERIARIEAGLLNQRMESQRDRFRGKSRSVSAQDRIAFAFAGLADTTSQLQSLCRYEATCRRGLNSATNTLARLQAERRAQERRSSAGFPDFAALPNEPATRPGTPSISPELLNMQKHDAPRVPFGFSRIDPAEPAQTRHSSHADPKAGESCG
jgi:hypothetical protein